jgi:signal transduction histidine kinase
MLKERDRLLSGAARGMGLLCTTSALVCVCLPGALSSAIGYAAAICCLAAMLIALWAIGRSRTLGWPLGAAALGVLALIAIGSGDGSGNVASVSALAVLAGGAIPAATIAFESRGIRFWMNAAAFAVTMAVLLAVLAADGAPLHRALPITLGGWAFATILAVWLGRVVPQTVRRISSMSDAYRAERQASEQEARRRQGARLLHDTVLATLTLLAHSGRGVSEDALREQAGEDAALLRQLRLGFTPNPSVSGDYKLKPVQESTLGNTLESVKQRFRRMGLEVAWHGTGQVLLPSDTLDAFLLALAECLENVRRHSGVDEAHVTITDDEATVRAMVTDSGIGFDLGSIPASRLGFTESIVARLRDVGGNARLFSSPGSGTTVVLEVPK